MKGMMTGNGNHATAETCLGKFVKLIGVAN